MAQQFNSAQFAWSDVTVQIGDKVLTGIQGVRYKQSQEKGVVYGKGNEPLAITRGNYAYEGSITILQSELDALEAASPTGNLLALKNMSFLIAYENDEGAFNMDILLGCEFMEREKGFQQNAPNMTIELPFLFLGIQINA